MNALIKIAMIALADDGLAQSNTAVGRVSTAAIYAVGTGVAAVALLGSLMATLWLYVQPHVGSAGGALIVAAAIAALWLGLFAFTRRSEAERQAPPFAGREGVVALIAETRKLFAENTGTVLLAALIAGVVAGTSGRPHTDR